MKQNWLQSNWLPCHQGAPGGPPSARSRQSTKQEPRVNGWPLAWLSHECLDGLPTNILYDFCFSWLSWFLLVYVGMPPSWIILTYLDLNWADPGDRVATLAIQQKDSWPILATFHIVQYLQFGGYMINYFVPSSSAQVLVPQIISPTIWELDFAKNRVQNPIVSMSQTNQMRNRIFWGSNWSTLFNMVRWFTKQMICWYNFERHLSTDFGATFSPGGQVDVAQESPILATIDLPRLLDVHEDGPAIVNMEIV